MDNWLAETRQAHKKALLLLRDLAIAAFFVALPFAFLFWGLGLFLGPIGPGIKRSAHSADLQLAHALGNALYSCANDNLGEFPDGTSSTAVFQKLLDGGYVSDPGYFYVPMRGKVKADPHQKILKPENVCFDVTTGASEKDSSSLPVLFLTGYRVTYAPGSAAVPIGKTFPPYLLSDSWFTSLDYAPGIAAYYLDNHTVWINAQGDSIPNFEPSTFDAHGKTYRQLAPLGVVQ